MNNSKQTKKRTGLARFLARVTLKIVLFSLFAVWVLNPDLKRAAIQLEHTFKPESLIETNFPGLSFINRAIDKQLNSRRGSEPKAVERFVLKNIRYVTDYDNWNNVEYWPRASEVWDRGQEDCDGRAILAASVLRSRGFSSAKLVVGLQHMWIQVDENEKDPSLPSHVIGLLDPDKRRQFKLDRNPTATHYFGLIRALLNPTALRDTSMGVFMDIPALRRMVLMLAILALCYHPCRELRGLLSVLVVGLVAANLLAQWDPSIGVLHAFVGIGIFVVAVLGALVLSSRKGSRA
jgi:hypothetical protein